MMGKQQTKHSLPHSANSVDTANELNRFYARFDVRDFSEDCARLLCQNSSTFLKLMLLPASFD